MRKAAQSYAAGAQGLAKLRGGRARPREATRRVHKATRSYAAGAQGCAKLRGGRRPHPWPPGRTHLGRPVGVLEPQNHLRERFARREGRLARDHALLSEEGVEDDLCEWRRYASPGAVEEGRAGLARLEVHEDVVGVVHGVHVRCDERRHSEAPTVHEQRAVDAPLHDGVGKAEAAASDALRQQLEEAEVEGPLGELDADRLADVRAPAKVGRVEREEVRRPRARGRLGDREEEPLAGGEGRRRVPRLPPPRPRAAATPTRRPPPPRHAAHARPTRGVTRPRDAPRHAAHVQPAPPRPRATRRPRPRDAPTPPRPRTANDPRHACSDQQPPPRRNLAP